ncbi:MAG: hypothetical protein MZU79_04535 [Anaerotruncus sp.]|nr:hypothetical protein [Anaerotruncus sp.]
MPSEKARRVPSSSSCLLGVDPAGPEAPRSRSPCGSTSTTPSTRSTRPSQALNKAYPAADDARDRRQERGRPADHGHDRQQPQDRGRPRQARRCTSTATCTATRSRAGTSRSTSSTTCSAATARTRRSRPSSTGPASTSSRSSTSTAATTSSPTPTTRAATAACASPSTTTRTAWSTRTRPTTSTATATSAQMRKKDPFGQYKTDPEDPRLLVRVKPGEKGEWTLLGEEGPRQRRRRPGQRGRRRLRRSQPQLGLRLGAALRAGRLRRISRSRPSGSRRLAEWTMTRTNIVVAWSFHNNGGMLLRGPSRKGLGEYPQQDVAVYDYPRQAGRADHPRLPLHDLLEGPLHDLRRFRRVDHPDAGRLRLSAPRSSRPSRRPSRASPSSREAGSPREEAVSGHLRGRRLRARAAQVQRQRRPGRALQALEAPSSTRSTATSRSAAGSR